MGLFDFIFGHRPKPTGQYGGIFKMLNGYVPRFTSWSGSIYEAELIRASINAVATHCSKLNVTTRGAARPKLQRKLQKGPNEWSTWSQFLYRLATILYVKNTAFVVPVFDEYGDVSGIYPALPEYCDIVQYGGIPYLRYKFAWGEWAAVELQLCGIMTRFQYKSDFFGEDNKALLSTLDLITIQEQGIQESITNGASYRFSARLTNFSSLEDLKKERKKFTDANFRREDKENAGLLLFPNTYSDIQQLTPKNYVCDADQMRAITDGVFRYFGVNDDILMNKAYGDTWAAFYEGAVEPFAVQFSEVVTKMLFSFRERSEGAYLMATSNRIQYMSNTDKQKVTETFADRGLATINEVREIWNLPPLPPEIGDKIPARGEYYDIREGKNNEQDDRREAE